MSKISAEHLSRGAYVYVRQSTADQLQHNHESRRRQYALAERARSLGWSEVVVIDDDLGVSASGVARLEFERLLAAICRGSVGAVVSIEASRLARNGRDWHTLLEFCALVGSLLVDEDGIYDPRSPNDRLLLGMKGTLSEMELSLLRQRSLEALKLKAARGELHTTVAIGYVRGPGDRIEMDADLRVREAISLVFRRFSELRSVRQVLLWLRQEAILLPSAVYGPEGRSLLWKLPVYNTVLHILTNPVYAGAYVFGRTESRVRIEQGRKHIGRGHRRAREQWQVLITEHHEGYIDWETYEHNQRMIADNANRGIAAAYPDVASRRVVAVSARSRSNRAAPVPVYIWLAGLPGWMLSEESWADRQGTTADLKRRTIFMRTPTNASSGARVEHGHPARGWLPVSLPWLPVSRCGRRALSGTLAVPGASRHIRKPQAIASGNKICT